MAVGLLRVAIVGQKHPDKAGLAKTGNPLEPGGEYDVHIHDQTGVHDRADVQSCVHIAQDSNGTFIRLV